MSSTVACAAAPVAPATTVVVRPGAPVVATRTASPARDDDDGDKVAECDRIIAVINAGVAGLEKGPKVDGDADAGVADLRAMAEVMDKVVADGAKVRLDIRQLKTYRSEYLAMAKDVAKAARDMAAAADAKDVARVAAAQTAMEAAVKKEDPLVDRINQFCQAP